MVTRVTAEIPSSSYYVTCRSLEESGLGVKWDKGKDNIWIMLCDSKKEAQTVFYNASNRVDQDRAEIHSAKPRLHNGAVYTLICRRRAFWWYQTGNFESRRTLRTRSRKACAHCSWRRTKPRGSNSTTQETP